MQGILRMTIPQYLFIESEETKGKILILHTRAPYVIAQVWMFRTQEELDAFMKTCKVPGVVQIAGYRILIVYSATLKPELWHRLEEFHIPDAIPGMAVFFLKERINPHTPKYARYEIK
jgi:hypothetical protein